jgi:hypothetical protein
MSFCKIPLFKCHAEVRAAKITDITPEGALVFGEIEFTHTPGPAWMNKHHPEVGGYFVIDEAGIPEYRRAAPFERDWVRIG